MSLGKLDKWSLDLGAGAFGSAGGEDFAWLKRLEPEAVVGCTIFVYRVTEADVARLKEQGQ